MTPTLMLRLEHAFIPGRDDAAAAAVAEIVTRPCFAALRRVALETARGRTMHHSRTTTERVKALMQDPRCDIVDMDSGREQELSASARLETGLLRSKDYWDVYPGPLEPHILVPYEPEHAQARIGAFCELAVVLRAIAGFVSVEMDHPMAHKVAIGLAKSSLERGLQQPGMTWRRIRERRTYSQKTLDREIPAPEWGLFLGRGHLASVSADVLEASGVFHQVRRLSDDLVFLQLTADPSDALRPDFDALLDPVRRVLAPVLSQPRLDQVTSQRQV
jgi:hypothetical protein